MTSFAPLGTPAPTFSLPDASGRIRSSDEFRGNWLLLMFLRHLG